MKFFFTALLCIATTLPFAQTVINGLSMPEGIASDGKLFFVSDQGQNPFLKDGDGFISEITADGKLLSLHFLPAQGFLNAPKGMTVSNGILYVADLDRVMGFDINSRRTVFELPIPGVTLLNDVCRLDSGDIGVTETITGNIYRISPKEKLYHLIANMPTVNGLAYNPHTKQLAVCTNGKNYGEGAVYISSIGGTFSQLPNLSQGFFDGIEWADDDTHLLISDWVTYPTQGFGKLWTYDLKRETASFVFTGESVADICYDAASKKVYMPQMLHNRVLIATRDELAKEGQNRFNQFSQYGVASAFAGGIYTGTETVKDWRLAGDFGIAAPDSVNGEVTMIDGNAYRTDATGSTSFLPDSSLLALSFATCFKADTILTLSAFASEELLKKLKTFIPHKNSLYAIRIKAVFDSIKTRAFSPLGRNLSKKLATQLDKQHVFSYNGTEGSLIGLYVPAYLDGINISGFHFHFLSDDRQKGGHVLHFSGSHYVVEIAEQRSLQLQFPSGETFQKFQFTDTDKDGLRKVEKGQ